jgi:hypothetical protein
MDAMSKKVSVILFLRRDYLGLRETLQSLRNQSYGNIELIALVCYEPEKGSLAEKSELLRARKLIKKYSDRFQGGHEIAPFEGAGASPASRGASLATGDYFLFVNAGDMLTAGCIASLVGAAEASLADMAVAPRLAVKTRKGEVLLYEKEIAPFQGGHCFEEFAAGSDFWGYYFLGNKLVSAGLWEAAAARLLGFPADAGAPSGLAEDVLLSAALFLAAKSIAVGGGGKNTRYSTGPTKTASCGPPPRIMSSWQAPWTPP